MIISRYVFREVLTSLLAVMFILLAAFLSQQVVRYLNYVAIGKISSNVMLTLISFEIPYLLALLLPLALSLGIILGLGRLYVNNEMIVMQMSGYDNRYLTRTIFYLSATISLFILFLMVWVNPVVSLQRQELMQTGDVTNHLIQTLMPGRFQVSLDGKYVMYVESLSRDHEKAKNVFLAEQIETAESKNNNEWRLIVAKQGYQEKDKHSNDQFFVTSDGYRYEGVPGQNDYKIIKFGKYAIRLQQANARTMHEADESLSTMQLIAEYGNPHRAAECQWRFSIPISAFLLAFLALPLSVRKPREGNRYIILLPVILIYVLYINMLSVAKHWVYEGVLPVSIGMWWVHGLILLLVLLLFYIRKKQWM